MAVKVSDSTGEAWFSAFNDEAEKIIGCTADELNILRSEVIKLETISKIQNIPKSLCSDFNMVVFSRKVK